MLLILVGMVCFLLGAVTATGVFIISWWLPAFRRHEAEIEAHARELEARIASGCRQRITRREP